MALLWAGGILWFAYGVATSSRSRSNGQDQPTDVTGATITDEDAKNFQAAVNTL